MPDLAKWLAKCTKLELQVLVKQSGISQHYIYLLSKKIRHASAEMAGTLEHVLGKITRGSKGRLPVVKRGDICAACRKCPYYKSKNLVGRPRIRATKKQKEV